MNRKMFMSKNLILDIDRPVVRLPHTKRRLCVLRRKPNRLVRWRRMELKMLDLELWQFWEQKKVVKREGCCAHVYVLFRLNSWVWATLIGFYVVMKSNLRNFVLKPKLSLKIVREVNWDGLQAAARKKKQLKAPHYLERHPHPITNFKLIETPLQTLSPTLKSRNFASPNPRTLQVLTNSSLNAFRAHPTRSNRSTRCHFNAEWVSPPKTKLYRK